MKKKNEKKKTKKKAWSTLEIYDLFHIDVSIES